MALNCAGLEKGLVLNAGLEHNSTLKTVDWFNPLGSAGTNGNAL